MSLIPSNEHSIIALHTYELIKVRIAAYKKKARALEKLSAYLGLLSMGAEHVNAYVQRIQRFPDPHRDDVAWIVVKTRKAADLFLVCINTKGDFKVHEIAMKVHNLTPYKRNMLVEQMKKNDKMDAHIKNAQAIHAIRNFEIKKV